ncbi:Rrf2 family transcriptional regulator [Rhodoferax sp.]|uniref:Rrf2 family transcriptional regulator n=1 Tax=Rhodoferax sp. TaxID=50421 RepID=UPI001EB6ABDA|nr:Rrf2 family transcriptional regulator [Rhodoferax sp.]MBT9505294.1 Rrf2 family transcriptional regulator [Rhodoferax sp.]
MRISTKSRFAVTAMIDVALRENAGPVPLSDIAVRHQISISYLEQMFSKLRQHGLVESTRGPGGGYALGHRGDAITVADIIEAVEGETKTQDATEDATQALWDSLNSKMLDYMQSITLHSLATDQRAHGFQVEEAPVTNRGVFKKPAAEPLRPSTPNSVFALGQSLLARGTA